MCRINDGYQWFGSNTDICWRHEPMPPTCTPCTALVYSLIYE